MTTDLATQETSLLEVQKLQEIVATAPEILQLNITSKTKAIEAGQKVIEMAKLGMNDFNDEQLATFMTKAKKTIDAMNERRKPFTQIVDAVKKQFTTLEGELKPIMEEVQGLRNSYATEKMKAKQEADRIAQLQLNKDKEVIEIRQLCEIEMGKFFNNCISKTKTDIANYFNELTLETIDEASTTFASTSTNFDLRYSIPTTIELGPCMMYTSLNDVEKIINEVLAVNYQTKKYEYTREINSTIKEYSDKLSSKKAELIAISKAGAEEKERLENEAAKRKEKEAEELKAQEIAREQKAQEDAAINASAATAGAMIDASVATTEAPNVKEGYSITLKSTAGYLLLVQFWFEKEGKNMTADKFEKFTFDRVKRFCEAYAAKNEEFIQSPLISYEPIYKAK